MSEFANILIVGSIPYPPFGGISSHLKSLVPRLREQGYRVSFIVNREEEQGLIQKDGMEILKWRFRRNWPVLLNAKRLFLNVKSFIFFKKYNLSLRHTLREIVFINMVVDVLAKKDIDLISFYDMRSAYSIPALRKILNIRTPIVLSMYADIYKDPDYFRSFSGLIGLMLETSNNIVASSKYSTRSVELLGLDSSKIEAVYYGVDLCHYSPKTERGRIRKALELGPDKKIFLFVGRMEKVMGLSAVLYVIPEIVSERDDVVFIVVGAKGKLTQQAYDLQSKYNNKVYVMVDVPFEDLRYYYSDCDIFIAPTEGRHASMGMSIKEAMASGRPVIATNAPGISEAVVDKQTGFLIQTNEDYSVDVKALKVAILECLNNPDNLDSTGVNARNRAEELFDKELTSQKMISMFDSLLEKSNT